MFQFCFTRKGICVPFYGLPDWMATGIPVIIYRPCNFQKICFSLDTAKYLGCILKILKESQQYIWFSRVTYKTCLQEFNTFCVYVDFEFRAIRVVCQVRHSGCQTTDKGSWVHDFLWRLKRISSKFERDNHTPPWQTKIEYPLLYQNPRMTKGKCSSQLDWLSGLTLICSGIYPPCHFLQDDYG